jgi:hypothetical protein
MPAQKVWRRQADALFLVQKRGLGKITGPFECTLIISEGRADLDNHAKQAIDFARDMQVITTARNICGVWSWNSARRSMAQGWF